MKLQDKLHKYEPFDCASGMAEALLATGTVEVYVPPVKIVHHHTIFQVSVGKIIDDTQEGPFILYNCDICGGGRMEGPTAQNLKVYHKPPNGFAQEVPGDVKVQYIKLRRQWEGK